MNTSNEISQKIISNAFASRQSLIERLGYEAVVSQIHCENPDVRIWIAKALVFDAPDMKASNLLCQLVKDNDPQVRVEAVDSLSAFCDENSYGALCSALYDKHALVRAFAAYGIAVVGKQINAKDAHEILGAALSSERDARVLVGVYEGLYILGYDNTLLDLINLFDTDDYHIHCSVLHALEEIVNIKNFLVIEKFLNSIALEKYPIAVRDAIRFVRQSISQFASDKI